MRVHYPFIVESYETDLWRQIHPSALQCRLQELTYRACAASGAGYADLRREGRFWALNRIHIRIEAWPLWGDEVQLSTWLRERTGPLYQRDYVLFRDDTLLVKATSSWTVLYLDGRGICRELVIPEAHMEHEDLMPFCGKVMLPRTLTATPAGSHTAAYSDLDSNAHVNNCIYLRWAMDLMGLDFLSAHRLTDIRTGYYREIHPGERVDFLRAASPDSLTQYIEGRVGGELSFVIQLDFTPAHR